MWFGRKEIDIEINQVRCEIARTNIAASSTEIPVSQSSNGITVSEKN